MFPTLFANNVPAEYHNGYVPNALTSDQFIQADC